MQNMKSLGKTKVSVKIIRNNPYWKKPWLLRQCLHLLGIAPYQDRKQTYHKRVIIVPVVKVMYIAKVFIRKIKGVMTNGRFK